MSYYKAKENKIKINFGFQLFYINKKLIYKEIFSLKNKNVLFIIDNL